MDLLALADFDLVVAHAGFARAARAAGRPKATLSRRVQSLERHLNTRLLERGPRGLRPTAAGATLHARIHPLLAELAEAEAATLASPGPPRGPLRVSAPVLLSHTALGRIAAGFLRRHPEVRLEITAEDRIADLAEDGIDVAIRVDPAPHASLVGRCVLRDERWLVAAPSVPRPEPAAPAGADLPAAFPALLRSPLPPGTIWRIRDGGALRRYAPDPVLRLSTLTMLRDAALAGAGAALLPRSIVGRDVARARLVRWGIDDRPPPELWALHTSRRQPSPAVTAFIAHLAAALADADT